MSVLMLASRNSKNPEVITALLKAGANVYAKSGSGKTIIDYAQENEQLKDTEVFRVLSSIYSQTANLFDLVMTGTPREIQKVIQQGAQVNAQVTGFSVGIGEEGQRSLNQWMKPPH